MIYEIKLKPKVEKFLDKLPQDVALRIIKKLKQLKENPFRYLEHYEGEGYKFRIGDYRALIDTLEGHENLRAGVDFENKILIVEVLDKRGRIYKRN
jgi:mRNA-degrading endonuclease RelE of RelBE toxin-antitoxin system